MVEVCATDRAHLRWGEERAQRIEGRREEGRVSRSGLKDSFAERPDHSNLCTSEFAQNSVRIPEI